MYKIESFFMLCKFDQGPSSNPWFNIQKSFALSLGTKSIVVLGSVGSGTKRVVDIGPPSWPNITS